MTEILPIPKDAKDLTNLLEEVNQSEYIGEITLAELNDLIKAQTIRFFYTDEQLMGMGAWITINTDWVELGPFYVAKAARGQGMGRTLLDTVLEYTTAYNLYAITRNNQMKDMFLRHHFKQIAFWQLPLAIMTHSITKLSPRKMLRFAAKGSHTNITHLIKLRK